MSTKSHVEQPNAKTLKYVYFFGGGEAEGNGEMKDVLGEKGAGLAEMTNAGLPVPPGFTIQTEACREYVRQGSVSKEAHFQVECALSRLEALQGQKLGAGENPLLVSVRTGAKFSMPGLTGTIVNLGLNDKSVEALAKHTNNPRFAADSYRRLIQTFGSEVLDIWEGEFEEALSAKKQKKRARLDSDLDAKTLQELVEDYKELVKKHTMKDFPQVANEQLLMAWDAAFRSWNTERIKHYRRINNISDDLGTAVNVQAMVFGNLGDTSGSGVGFTRNPATGTKEFYGEFLMNAQGEDLVAGIRTPVHISKLEKIMPDVYYQLRDITTRLEEHYKDLQEFEFTIQEGKVYLRETRRGKRTGVAAVRVAVEMVEEGLITKEEAIFRVNPDQLGDFMVQRLDEGNTKVDVLATGTPASPGVAVGRIVFTNYEAVEKTGRGKKTPIILVLSYPTPEDIHLMEVADGILVAREGRDGHGAVVARGMRKCCVAGSGEIAVDEKAREMRVKGQVFKEGDWISLDGTTGRVIKGKLNIIDPKGDETELLKFMGWAEKFRKLGVRANADIPRDAIEARAFGAEGVGLCRTEHMFFGEQRIPHMRTMILAVNQKDRRAALKRLLPMQRKDFDLIFRAMDGFPVTIRTLDAPLHEFLPRREELMVDIALLSSYSAKQKKELVTKYKDYAIKGVGDLKKALPALLSRVERLDEFNPMLGHRGCRLGITYPEITEMQARAIFEAAVDCTKKGIKVLPEVMIPLTATLKEMANQAAIVDRVAAEVFKEKEQKVDYMVGTMIGLPRAALVADEIAQEAKFFSFGTNDLTQTTFGISRDDVDKVLPSYLVEGILKQDPFVVLDREGVGQLVKIATERGRKTRPNLRVGICGEHGEKRSSVEFCHQVGADYISCSSSCVLSARLAAAQAGAGGKCETEKCSGTK